MQSRFEPTTFAIAVLFAFSYLAFAAVVVQDLSSPFAGREDANQFEYIGYYLFTNLTFIPLPSLNLVNNQVFYPYGTTSAFQSWGLERDYFYAVLYALFGLGPWLKIYYLLSVATVLCGSFALLCREYSKPVSGLGALVIAFFGFYAIHEYPEHLNIAVTHWTVLNIVADFVLTRRVVGRESVSLHFLLLRGLLLVLAIGQDLGYVAGFALMSFAITTVFLCALVGWRAWRARASGVAAASMALQLAQFRGDFRAHPLVAFALLSLALIVSFLHVPLVLQITSAARHFDFRGYGGHQYWVNPLRMLVPILPQINPIDQGWRLRPLLGDQPDGFSAGSPGWFLVVFAAIGVFYSRKNLLSFIPILTMLAICLLYRPGFPTLNQLFPWFAFFRVGGRATIIYPTILVLLGLGGMQTGGKTSRQWLILMGGVLFVLSITELWTSYSFKRPGRVSIATRYFKPPAEPFRFGQEFFAYMNYVKAQPGEAVLDWPFCIASGNGVGDELCPLYDRNNGIAALRRFHTKKVMGQYFGRLHPTQIQPYLDAGWLTLLRPDSTDSSRVHCFDEHEWEFFTRFFTLNGFAGINLYVDLIPPDCLAQFYDRYGSPVIKATVPVAGRVEFIPKAAMLRSRTNSSKGIALRLRGE